MKKTVGLLAGLLTIGAASAVPQKPDDVRHTAQRVEAILEQMTLEEKISMVHAQSIFSSSGVPRLGIPELWMSDGPHGVRAEINWNDFDYAGWSSDSCTAFPALTCLAATFNPELAHAYGVAVGEEARYRNKDVLLGPGVNIYRTPLNGRNFEYMGEDPLLASRMAVPYIRGLQSNGVAACVKHFALNNQETWRHWVNVNLSDRALHEIYLPAFKASVQDGGVWCIMGSYNRIRGQHGCHNDFLLNRILREEWKFDGVVVSDWGGVHNTREAALCGLDLEMGTWTDGLESYGKTTFDNYYMAGPLLELVRSGEIPESVIDDKVRRLLTLIFRTKLNLSRPLGSLATLEHAAVARRIAEEGIVLLKNDGGFFPVEKNRYRKILVIGENAVRQLTLGGGSSELKARREISPLGGLLRKYGDERIAYTMGYGSGPSVYAKVAESPYDADSLRRVAVEMARVAEAVLFIGGLNKNHQQDCEAGDRLSYDLPFGQNELLDAITAVNENVGVVLIGGNAVAMPWLDKVKGVMQAWYLGSEAGEALAEVIAGDVNPSGRLPFTIPEKLADNGAHAFGKRSYPGVDGEQIYLEDILVGYRWHDTKKIRPRFPFGYGLSYTTFTYGRLSADKKAYGKQDTVMLSVTLTNSGGREGAETIQIYVGQSRPSVIRPVKELKAFEKVLLQVGETREVTFELPVAVFAYYDEKTGGWKVESDKYVLYCGASAGEIESAVTVQVK
ncbi:beta-glucosidase family protein [Alistipes sp.]|uniref:beta-glucosidase family protein n=1 Tax=Alistipes sp. TaxID=1872444 RepID=UPI003AEF8EA9